MLGNDKGRPREEEWLHRGRLNPLQLGRGWGEWRQGQSVQGHNVGEERRLQDGGVLRSKHGTREHARDHHGSAYIGKILGVMWEAANQRRANSVNLRKWKTQNAADHN